MKADVLVIDGRHALWRTSDAFRDLSAEVDGETIGTGGLYGFLGLALRVHARYGGRTVVAWEGDRSKNFRSKLFPAYKARDVERSPEERELINDMADQERRLMEMLTALGVEQYLADGCEADDVIGRIAFADSLNGKHVLIYSGDSDLRQLVRDGGGQAGAVRVCAPDPFRHKDKLYDECAVEEKHGVKPRLLAHLKALCGDASDNIPGVRGVGPKTAASLINHYGSLKRVLRAAIRGDDSWPSTPRFRQLIAASVKDVVLYYRLTRIRINAPMIRVPAQRDQAEVVRLLRAYKFRSLIYPNELNGLMRLGA